MGLIYNENKEAFKKMYEYVEEVASFLYEAQGVRLINELSLKKLKYLSESDQVDEDAFPVIAPKAKQIVEFASNNLYYLNPQTHKRVYNLSNLNTTLKPAIEQLKEALAAYVPNNCIVPRESVKKLKDPTLKPATGFNKKNREQNGKSKRTVQHFKPDDIFVTPSKDTLEKIEELLKLYSIKLIKTGIFEKNNSKNPARKRDKRVTLMSEIERYKKIKYLTKKREDKINDKLDELIPEVEGFNDVQETMIESIGELEYIKRKLAAFKAMITKSYNWSDEAEKFIAENEIVVDTKQGKKPR